MKQFEITIKCDNGEVYHKTIKGTLSQAKHKTGELMEKLMLNNKVLTSVEIVPIRGIKDKIKLLYYKIKSPLFWYIMGFMTLYIYQL
jgi:hypothetical protein